MSRSLFGMLFSGATRNLRSARRPRARRRGVTMVETTLCIVLLGTTATAISGLYVTGLRSVGENDERTLTDSGLRSELEELIAQPFAATLAAGSGIKSVPVAKTTVTVNWTAALYDLDGDAVPEPNAMLIQVSENGRSLSVVVVDHGDSVVKLP